MMRHGSETWMTTLTIRNVDPALKEELRVRAARHGRSMEAELRHILKEALGGEKRRAEPNLAETIRRRFLPLGAADELEPHPPVPVRDPPQFDQRSSSTPTSSPN
jgi:plasmid stability protein